MNLNENCSNLLEQYETNNPNFESCLRNVFSVECPETLNEIEDESVKQRCKEQFSFLGWENKNKCWFKDYNGIPINNIQYKKLSSQEKKECDKLFKASYLKFQNEHHKNEYKPWNIPNIRDVNNIDIRKGRLCPRNKKKYNQINNPNYKRECSFVYENGRTDETASGGCAIFENEWLGCNEDQHYNKECTKCIND